MRQDTAGVGCGPAGRHSAAEASSLKLGALDLLFALPLRTNTDSSGGLFSMDCPGGES